MAAIDPDDDEIRRYVVRRYAYDPQRHERRHQVIAAVDNEREYRAVLKEADTQLRRRRAAGEAIEACEHISGVVLEPGHRRLQQNGRLLRRAIQHGADIDELLRHLELPPNVGVIRAGQPSRPARRPR
jgi:GNAT superfamily N-acetyltransferase